VYKWPQILPWFRSNARRKTDTADVTAIKDAAKVDTKVAIDNVADYLFALDRRISDLSAKVDNLAIKVDSDTASRQQFQAKLDDVTTTVNMGVVYAQRMPIMYKLDAAIVYFMLHGNGNVKEEVVRLLKEEPNGLQHWRTALNNHMKKYGPSNDRYFVDTIGYIDHKVGV
jgi:hypothetical protein